MLAEFENVVDAASARAAFHTWMFERALPFWAGAGWDAPGLGAREHLQIDGSPAAVGYKRMRVQARQIYAFSHAALLGWSEGAGLAQDGYRFITKVGERAEGGWVRRLRPDGDRILDPATDLYDQAFVLFALAWYARLTGGNEPLEQARRTTQWIRGHMRQPPQGFHNVLPPEGGPRQQNPHMHLLEAALALYETSREPLYLELAHELVELFRQQLFDRETGTLGEFFTEHWSPAPGEAGDHVEPGHHFEWVWLLDQYERLTGVDARAEMAALYRVACRHGSDPVTGLVWDRIGRDGRVLQRSTRLWPQTEALKAHVVMTRLGLARQGVIAEVVRNLGARFLSDRPAGAWIDQFSAAGDAAVDKIPTSSFYHVFMAYGELQRSAGAPTLEGAGPGA